MNANKYNTVVFPIDIITHSTATRDLHLLVVYAADQFATAWEGIITDIALHGYALELSGNALKLHGYALELSGNALELHGYALELPAW